MNLRQVQNKHKRLYYGLDFCQIQKSDEEANSLAILKYNNHCKLSANVVAKVGNSICSRAETRIDHSIGCNPVPLSHIFNIYLIDKSCIVIVLISNCICDTFIVILQ